MTGEARAPGAEAPKDTRERLIEAGMAVFAERGYEEASLREICSRAGANPAAVNYHFGDKQRFYAEVLNVCHEQARSKRRMPQLDDDPEHPEEVLRAWVQWFVTLLLVEGSAGPLGRLMAREMADPSPALEELVKRSFLPIHQALSEIVEAVLKATPGAPSEPRNRGLCVNSILGQCLFYRHSQPAVEHLERLAPALTKSGLGEPGLGFDEIFLQELDVLARHIAEFSLAGLGGSANRP